MINLKQYSLQVIVIFIMIFFCIKCAR